MDTRACYFSSKGILKTEYTQEDSVATLIDDDTRMWNVNKLRYLFNPCVVADILKVVICPRVVTIDRRIKAHERSGLFSVRSCYRFIKARLGSHSAEASTIGTHQILWKQIWKMPVPSKIKFFAWNAFFFFFLFLEEPVATHIVASSQVY